LPDYRASLVRGGLKGARIGVLRQAYERDTLDAEIVTVFGAAIEDLKKAGAVIVDPAAVDELRDIRRAQGSGSCAGFKHDINRYLASLGDRVPVKSLEEIIRSRRFHPSVELRLTRAQEGPENGLDSDACRAEADYRERFRAAVLKTMEAHRLQAFVYPTWSNLPRLIGDLNTPHGDNSQVFSPTTGWPAIQVPMGYTRGGKLPAGITFFGRAWDEPTLIKLAYDYEQATRHRRPPPLQ
jgi:Asp-tRNA(Asn)/Glu-tRNA(Gln) amidotransferase A subunit family amidase